MNPRLLFPMLALLLAAGCASVPKSAVAPAPAAAAPAAATDAEPIAAPEPATAAVAGAEAAPSAPVEAAPAAITSAEADFEAIYGAPAAGPDGTPASASSHAALDPWEPLNRKVHAFNSALDRAIMRPLARAYVTVLPQPVRTGVGNVFDNLSSPLIFANLLLQGRPREAVETLGRFLVNSTVGLCGIFDPASKVLKMHRHGADFGRTLARWGWKQSRYLELPFLGPRTLRDTVGAIGDVSFSPMSYIEHDRTRLGLEALWVINVRANLLSLDDLRSAAPDEYALTRDAWIARRKYQVASDRSERDEGNETGLPDYLRELEPTPATAEPVP